MNKTCNLVFKNKKEKLKNDNNEFGYNLDKYIKEENDYSKVYLFNNKNYVYNLKKDR